MKKRNRSEKQTETRNSKLREITKYPANKIAELLHSAFPWLTPNEITALGTAGVGILALYVTRLEKEGRIDRSTGISLLSGYLALSATDMLDGSLARYLKEQRKTSHDSSVGQLVDSLSDRVQEAFAAWMAMYLAVSRKDKVWFVIATLSALTNPMTSLVRAYAEKEGIVVPESGRGFGIFGTRVARAAGAGVRFLPQRKVGVSSAQALVDSVTLAASTQTTVARLKAVKQRDAERVLDTQSVAEADRRFKLLAGLAVITGTTTAVLFAKLRKKLK